MGPDLEYNKRPTWNYFTGLPGTGKKSVCAQYGEEFMKMGGDKKRVVSTWNLETPESLFR